MLLKTSEKLALFAAWSRWWRLAGMWIVGLLVMLRYIHSIDMIISVDNRNTWFRILMRARLWGISLYLVIRWYNDWFLLLQHTNTIYIEINFVNVLTVCIRILFPSGKYKTIFINLYSIYDTNIDAYFNLKIIISSQNNSLSEKDHREQYFNNTYGYLNSPHIRLNDSLFQVSK